MTSSGASLLIFGAFKANLATGELWRNGRPVRLQPQPFKVLALLLERQGELVTREEIRQLLWGQATNVDFEHGLNFAIRRIRDTLGDDAERPRYIETLPRRGYRFIAPVERAGTVTASRESAQQTAAVSGGRAVSISDAFRPPQQLTRTEAAGLGASAVAATQEIEPARAVREYESIATVQTAAPPDGRGHGPEAPTRQEKGVTARQGRWIGLALVAVVGVAAAAGAYLFLRSRSTPKLTERDTLVLSDFTNTTGDPVFDGTLREGLSAQLEQSPFLNLLSDTRVAQTLALMAQPRDARLTPELAHEVCQRTASAASIEGSIANLGSQYVVGLKAVNCQSGDTLAEEQVTANGKEHVLKALGEAATKLREKLGESLASIREYDAPPKKVTTAKLEALRAYSVGWRMWMMNGDMAAAISSFGRAIKLDPAFAMAYVQLGNDYYSFGEIVRAADYIRKAYELRNRVSERERFYIEHEYYVFVTRDLEAAREVAELWIQAYPRDPTAYAALSGVYVLSGRPDKALVQSQESSTLAGPTGASYASLVILDLALYRLKDARATAQESINRGLDTPMLQIQLYLIDFLQHDTAAMERDAASLADKPGFEDIMLNYESDTATYFGQFVKARDLTQRAMESAERVGEEEEAASYEAEDAVREALVGNAALARQEAEQAVALSNGRDVEAISAIGLALAGDWHEAGHLADDLDRRFPNDTILQSDYLPMIRAGGFLGGSNASKEAGKAVEALSTAALYEQADTSPTLDFALYPAYLRGQAYLAARKGAEAEAEFQKILDHPGIVLNTPIGALAHLGLGRAYALEARSTAVSAVRNAANVTTGRTPTGRGRLPVPRPEALAKARAAYQGFFALWKDADPDIPILKRAKAEYAKLN
jgi:eukaryotic-like serine/threonine-protein kinase